MNLNAILVGTKSISECHCRGFQAAFSSIAAESEVPGEEEPSGEKLGSFSAFRDLHRSLEREGGICFLFAVWKSVLHFCSKKNFSSFLIKQWGVLYG